MKVRRNLPSEVGLELKKQIVMMKTLEIMNIKSGDIAVLTIWSSDFTIECKGAISMISEKELINEWFVALKDSEGIDLARFIKLKDVKKGDFFKCLLGSKVLRKGSYDRSAKKYDNTYCDDFFCSSRMLKGTELVIAGFTY